MSDFQILALHAEQFAGYFSKTNEELAALGAKRLTVTSKPGFPCRVSLEDAEIGEEVLLLPHLYHDSNSPYRASGPIYIRKIANQIVLAPNEIPAVLPNRLLSLRFYDVAGMMVDATVTEGRILSKVLPQIFENQSVDYVQIHNAKAGCYSCEARRVSKNA